MIAKIAVAAATFAIDKPYSYWIPEGMQLSVGCRVQVPFGRGNKPTEGVVLGLEEGDITGLKPVSLCLDEEPLLDRRALQLASFLRERYFCTFFDAVRVMLPAGLWFQTKEIYSLTEDRTWEGATIRQPHAPGILQRLADFGGTASTDKLKDLAPDEEALHKALGYLLKKKWVSCSQDMKRRARDKSEKMASLAIPAEEAMTFASGLPRNANLQRAVLETLCAVGTVSVKELCYFTGASTATVNRLEKLGYVALAEKPVLRCSQIKAVLVDGPLVLNGQQQAAYDGLMAQMQENNPGTALLYGVTGSGKTSVYLKLIRACLDMGKAAVLLVPEIALTPQLLGVLAGHFGDRVAVLHSSLPAGERYDQWKRVRSGDASVVVGTRSAVFAPCPDLGLIILDEEQEHSYKSENSPRYAAQEVAFWRGLKEKALVLLGSATPSVETMYHARAGHHRLYTLTQRFNGRPLPAVEMVDMKEELKEGNDTSLSYPLREAIRDTADAGKQTILFLNRRGNSRALVCMKCGEAPECPRCSARLTFHSANNRLMCHYCGHSVRAQQKCPKCGGQFKRVGTGTQKVQEELLELMPDLKTDRMDTDTVNPGNTHEDILSRFQQENTPVLLGTQMVAKGLNLPNVTLVGVLDADLSLYSDSYRAAETTFNMLTQVVGRAGRGDTPGRAMIQTLAPEHKVLTLAAKQDYEGFYNLEIDLRRRQNLPPFGDLVHFTFSGLYEEQVIRGAVKLRDSLGHCLREMGAEGWNLLGPAPCPVPKINYNLRYRLVLRCKMDPQKRQLIAHLLRQFALDKENRGVFAFADVNGFD